MEIVREEGREGERGRSLWRGVEVMGVLLGEGNYRFEE